MLYVNCLAQELEKPAGWLLSSGGVCSGGCGFAPHRKKLNSGQPGGLQGLPFLRGRAAWRRGAGTQSYAGISLSQGDEPLQTHPGLPGHFSLCSLGLRALPGSEEVQRVDSHVPGEEHVEVAEPEQLAAVAGHGSLEESEDRS